MRGFRVSALLLALFIGACDDDPSDPCEAGCVEGVDLAIVEAEVEWADDQDVDPRVGQRLVQPGDELTMHYRVVNRGSVASEPATLFVGMYHNEGNLSVIAMMPFGEWIEIPALEPGESVEATVERGAPNTMWLASDRGVAVFELFGEGGGRHYDAVPENAFVEIEYVVALPVAAVTVAGSADPLPAGETRSFDVTIRNESAIAPIEAGTELTTCLFLETLDGPQCAPIGSFATVQADVEPGEETMAGVAITVDPVVYGQVHDYELVGVGVCAERRCDMVELTILPPDESPRE